MYVACISSLTRRRVSSDTVFALSSGRGKCGVAVIRVSGPMTSQILRDIGRFSSLPKPRQAVLRNLYSPTTELRLDHGLLLWFPGRRITFSTYNFDTTTMNLVCSFSYDLPWSVDNHAAGKSLTRFHKMFFNIFHEIDPGALYNNNIRIIYLRNHYYNNIWHFPLACNRSL